ncbi:MAG TPA: DinB family protein [Chthoniobacterales bacterium]|nr:DinB family protein [Chthoniobacterales bacterium]
MTTPRRWFDRKFELGLGAEAAPELLERLRRAPERLADAVRGLPAEILTHRPDGKWSIQENAGHLFDLESLWDQRLDDYGAGAEELHPADLENRKTHEAGHNDRPISDILAGFSATRHRIVERIARMSPAELARTALHPRLRQPMSIVDLCFFVAEHDDHHLRTIEELRSAG